MGELNKEKEKNKNLSYDLGEEKENNLILLKKIEKISNLLEEEKKYNQIINEKLKEHEKSTYKNLSKMTELYEIIEEKDKKIGKLKIKLSRFPFELATGERLMSIIFTSSDRRILHSIICKNTDSFSKIETELYDKFPQYRKYEGCFIHNGRKINKYKSLENNNIYNNDIINLQLF